eukprot:CAMPEP_0118811538 /NCGR_PEP_ID=MMETSP1162-20130426/1709_1 /TAXON_ID=33656 /ORGANISM="Phaeocystis Sp, Strain CCMP2710" /LENGTH=130 /DNA_ID=CAMNT_0006741183 /DNA_START=58 /DNA_END=450 /DNA_ORIENTATION=-
MKLFVVLAVLGSCSAFAPAAGVRPAVARSSALAVRQTAPVMELETVDTWWGDKEYPDSVVLGIGKNVPSKFYGVTSGLALGIGLYCIAQSNLLNILSGSSVNGFYVFGSLLVPYSWGLHVASWIQKQNGK